MIENGYYPAGAQYDSAAPWNEPQSEQDEYRCIATQSMTMEGRSYGYDDEDACANFYTHHYSIPDLLATLKGYVEADLEKTKPKTSKWYRLRGVLDDIAAWALSDNEVDTTD